MNITIHTIDSGDENIRDVSAISLPNKLEYCMRHDYQFIRERFISKNIYFMEIERLLQILEALKNTDWVISMGADTLITNMGIKAEDIISKYAGVDIIVGRDVNGINCDVLFVRKCDGVTNWIMTLVYKTKEYRAYQFAMEAIKPEGANIAIIPQKEINAMPYWLYNYPDDKGGTWQEGDYIFHAAGLGKEARVAVMKEIAGKVKR